ncbi:deoxyribonucleoside regulator [Spirochaetia bacterium]|nr:deoxyribonucleoside regulator [Spirochaetia bacterium]
MDFEEELITKAAWYYFLENKTQQAISELLGVSRMRVIRLLDKARQTGVIQFKIRNDNARRMGIEKQLIETYGLKDSYVIPTPADSDTAAVNDAIADAAAMYINAQLPPDAFINIGYGDTSGKTLNSLAKIAETPISCISLTGGVSIYLPNTRSNVFNARLFLVPAPLVVSSKEMVGAILAENPVKEVLSMVSLASFTIIGIGGMGENATIVKSGVITKSDFLHLKMQGAVGDMLCHFFDKDGKMVLTPLENRLVSTSLDVLMNLPNVIAVAAGEEKKEAIKGALVAGYIDTLITNESTAHWLINNGGTHG